jgi:hypothetical protein
MRQSAGKTLWFPLVRTIPSVPVRFEARVKAIEHNMVEIFLVERETCLANFSVTTKTTQHPQLWFIYLQIRAARTIDSRITDVTVPTLGI